MSFNSKIKPDEEDDDEESDLKIAAPILNVISSKWCCVAGQHKTIVRIHDHRYTHRLNFPMAKCTWQCAHISSECTSHKMKRKKKKKIRQRHHDWDLHRAMLDALHGKGIWQPNDISVANIKDERRTKKQLFLLLALLFPFYFSPFSLHSTVHIPWYQVTWI